MNIYDEYDIEIQDERTKKIAQDVARDILENELSVVIFGVRDDNLVEFVDSCPSMFRAEHKNIKEYLTKYKKVIIVYGKVKDGVNMESESHT